ncbi:MAG: hypothetical protein AB1679_33060 [Actinomycetota bacterium]|jgi:hypothetical protein
MNKLFATWHHPADIDLDAGLDAAELLTRARDLLAEIPELADTLDLVDVALSEVSGWFDRRDSTPLISAVVKGG